MNNQCDSERFLSWLGEVLRSADDVKVDVVLVDRPTGRSVVQVIFRNVPGPLARVEVSPLVRG